MSNELVREERYIVFKISDLGNSIKGDEIRRLAREYAEQRRLKGKKPLECVVVEKDWPEYEPTWRAIEARATGAQPAPTEMSITTGTLSEMFLSLDGHDKAQPGYEWRKGWNDAIRQAMDYAQPAPSVPSVPDTYAAGINAVAAMLQSKADEYAKEHGHDDMGGLSFGPGMGGEIKMDYYTNLVELVDDVRAMLADAPSQEKDNGSI